LVWLGAVLLVTRTDSGSDGCSSGDEGILNPGPVSQGQKSPRGLRLAGFLKGQSDNVHACLRRCRTKPAAARAARPLKKATVDDSGITVKERVGSVAASVAPDPATL